MTTHQELFQCAYSAGLTSKQDIHVQVMHKGIQLCAEVIELFDINGMEWVKLQNGFMGTFSRPCKAVKACEGMQDGHSCVCANTAVSGRFSQACLEGGFCRPGVVAPDDSLKNETKGIARVW